MPNMQKNKNVHEYSMKKKFMFLSFLIYFDMVLSH